MAGETDVTQAQKLFSNLPTKNYLPIYREGLPNNQPDYQKIVNLLEFKKEEVSKATGVSKVSVRYDERIPAELKNRIEEWAVALELVAGHFQGDATKTALWFKLPNPLLGNISPRDMIRFGRFKKLLRFIQNSLDENLR